MNLLHMKYAVVIAEKKSINRAAEVLFVGQSALSRSVKELESSLGIYPYDEENARHLAELLLKGCSKN